LIHFDDFNYFNYYVYTFFIHLLKLPDLQIHISLTYHLIDAQMEYSMGLIIDEYEIISYFFI
jgi:hypothetical protein